MRVVFSSALIWAASATSLRPRSIVIGATTARAAIACSNATASSSAWVARGRGRVPPLQVGPDGGSERVRGFSLCSFGHGAFSHYLRDAHRAFVSSRLPSARVLTIGAS